MTRSTLATMFVVAIVVVGQRPARVSAQDKADIEGRWTINRDLSEFPREVGFDLDGLPTGGTSSSGGGGGGGRGRRGGGGGGGGATGNGIFPRRESEEDVKRAKQLTAEVRNPSTHLTIVETATAFTITDDRGQARIFHPDGSAGVVQLEGVSVGVTAKREADRLIVVYNVEQGRELRYTYARTPKTSQLMVYVQFVERGGGDSVRRIYEPTRDNEVLPEVTTAGGVTDKPAAGLPGSGLPGSGLPGSGLPPNGAPANGIPPAAAPRSSNAAAPPSPALEVPRNQRPDAELKGVTKLGVVVEDLSPEATACKLNQGTLETAVSKRLTDAGFKILRNSDEDTYVYVNVNTARLSTGLCVSRYDVFLYSHAAAKLSYQETPVLVQVSLLHQGGIGGGAPDAHAASVMRDVGEYVDQVATRIRDAGK